MSEANGRPAASSTFIGWVEAGCFVVALAVLNLAYGAGHAAGADPVAFLVYAMGSAASMLLLITGPGRDWRAVMLHPLSWVVGAGIIGMEAAYFMLLKFVTPADGSLLIRLNLPFSIIAGWLILGRTQRPLALLGVGFLVAAVAWYTLGLDTSNLVMAVILSVLCALISTVRNFGAEFHPWNRNARTIHEKMRITGLMLLVTSIAGTSLVAVLMLLTANNLIAPVPGIPTFDRFLHQPTILLGGFMGMLVLTAMQYFGFSSVVKIGTESFIAANSFVPLSTLVLQYVATGLGLMVVATTDWRFFPAMVVVIIGVMIFIAAGRRA